MKKEPSKKYLLTTNRNVSSMEIKESKLLNKVFNENKLLKIFLRTGNYKKWKKARKKTY